MIDEEKKTIDMHKQKQRIRYNRQKVWHQTWHMLNVYKFWSPKGLRYFLFWPRTISNKKNQKIFIIINELSNVSMN